MSHLGSEEVRFTTVATRPSSTGQIIHTARLLTVRDGKREVIGQQDITLPAGIHPGVPDDEMQYRAISSAYARQLKHLVAKRIPIDFLHYIRTEEDFRAFTAR